VTERVSTRISSKKIVEVLPTRSPEDWLPGNENPHGRTSGDEERLTITGIILRKKTGTLQVRGASRKQ